MNLKDRRQTKLVVDKRKKVMDAEPKNPAPQDNTFIRNEGLDAIRDIVERNDEQKKMLEVKKWRREETDDAINDNEPIYEPDPNIKGALQRFDKDKVFKRGGYKRIQ